ncbi:AAA family ATPase [Delftia tsuruhatensis]|uniref:AAA family ATPase n=1 Tax=Delftia tsuruhatensis TaxID=180282 RepID=UPI0031D2C8F2
MSGPARLLQLPRSYWRAALLALFTLFIGTAILLPRYNPVTRGSLQGAESSGRVWNEIILWRLALMEHVRQHESWPQDIASVAPEIAEPRVRMSSPRPFVLQADIVRDSQMGVLSGTQVLLQLNMPSQDWSCQGGQPPTPPRYLPLNCSPSPSQPEHEPFGWLRNIIWTCALVFGGLALLWLVRHPLIGPAQLKPGRLRRKPYQHLPQLDRLLRLTGRRSAVLRAAGIRPPDWQRALRLASASPAARVRALAERLSATCKTAEGEWPVPGGMFEWTLPPDLPIALGRCLVYALPEQLEELEEGELVRQLRLLQTGGDVVLIVSPQHPQSPMPLLQRHAEDRANLHAVLDSPGQTEWLMGGEPAQVLLRLLAAQLQVTRISPYQTRGGVTREDVFFGRERLLARVLNREPANYLVVGGRQLGKSSLLKAVQRRLQEHPSIACHYLSLRDHRLTPRLATHFGLPVETPLEAIIEHLQSQSQGRRLYLLIDEADLFFRDEARNGYPQLSALRALSEEGRCWFMLAGFWDLYAAALLDYQSPLRNFGDILAIGGLEPSACQALATEPLRRLRVGYANDALAERLIEASGRRANLVAILCQECLQALGPDERVIEERHLRQALESQPVQDALVGWGRLSTDEQACRLDRIAVYHTAQQGHTSLTALDALVQAHGATGQAQALRRSLARLQLAYVLRRDETHGVHDARYVFTIPLLQRQFEPQETELLLRQELESLGRGLNS